MGVLQNCPNCGSSIVLQNRKNGKYQYECGGDCWTRTKWFWSENEAAYAWNKLVKEPKMEEGSNIVQGTWKKRMKEHETPYYKSFTPIWSCSECGTEYDPSFCMTINSCPNCGAIMEEADGA